MPEQLNRFPQTDVAEALTNPEATAKLAITTESRPSRPAGKRNGWRRSFLKATRKTLQRREAELEAHDGYEELCGRFINTLATLVCALLLTASAASAKTITVTGTGDSFNGDYVKAEMVRAFLVSAEYRQRFGQ